MTREKRGSNKKRKKKKNTPERRVRESKAEFS